MEVFLEANNFIAALSSRDGDAPSVNMMKLDEKKRLSKEESLSCLSQKTIYEANV